MKEKVLSSTKAKLIDIMKCGGEISVEEGADALDLATTTVRQHLAKLEDQGFVKTRHKRYGRGRPLKMYSLTQESDVWYDSQESDILAGLIEFLEENDAEDLLSQYFEGLAEEFFESFERFADGRDGSRVELLCRFMKLRGFVPECFGENDEEPFDITFCHCPRRAAAESSAVPCMAEQRLLERALGFDLTRVRHIVDGDEVCEYRRTDDLD
ncbi:MAG: helix-turn-helix transcriptional regulator [Myxococcota bacterium]